MTGFVDNKRLWGNLGNRIAPSAAKIDTGWVAGEQPPHEWENSERYTSQRLLNHCINRDGMNGPKPGRLTGPELCTQAVSGIARWNNQNDNRWSTGSDEIKDACLAWNYERDMPMLVYADNDDITAGQIRTIDAWDYKDNLLSQVRPIQTAYTPASYSDNFLVAASATKLYVWYRHSFNTEIARYDLVNWTGIPEAEYRTGQTTYTEMILFDMFSGDNLMLFKGKGSTVDVLRKIRGADFSTDIVGNGNLDVGGGYSTIDAGITHRDADGLVWFMSHVSGSSHHLNCARAFDLGVPTSPSSPLSANFYDGTWGNLVSTGESVLCTGYAADVLGTNQIIKKWSNNQNAVSDMHEIMNCNQDSSILVGFDGLNVYVLYEVSSDLIYNGSPTNRHWAWTRFNSQEFAKDTDLTTEADRLRFPAPNLYGDDEANTTRSNQWAKMFFDGNNMWVVQRNEPSPNYIIRIPAIGHRQCNVSHG